MLFEIECDSKNALTEERAFQQRVEKRRFGYFFPHLAWLGGVATSALMTARLIRPSQDAEVSTSFKMAVLAGLFTALSCVASRSAKAKDEDVDDVLWQSRGRALLLDDRINQMAQDRADAVQEIIECTIS